MKYYYCYWAQLTQNGWINIDQDIADCGGLVKYQGEEVDALAFFFTDNPGHGGIYTSGIDLKNDQGLGYDEWTDDPPDVYYEYYNPYAVEPDLEDYDCAEEAAAFGWIFEEMLTDDDNVDEDWKYDRRLCLLIENATPNHSKVWEETENAAL